MNSSKISSLSVDNSPLIIWSEWGSWEFHKNENNIQRQRDCLSEKGCNEDALEIVPCPVECPYLSGWTSWKKDVATGVG